MASGDIGIGKLIEQTRYRDAIHIAVAPIEAGEKLAPGTRIGISNGKAMEIDPAVGIVDPFLTKTVRPGQWFYVFLFPGSIESLRHEWAHPAFDKASPPPASPLPEKAKSEAWLREYADRVNPYLKGQEAYKTLLRDLEDKAITYHGIDMHDRSELIDEEDLRLHASIVLGKEINFDEFEYFSCTC